jgi:hypothetical protein
MNASAFRTFNELAVATFDHALKIEQSAHSEYQSLMLRTGYWMMIDLKGSATYRQRYGSENSFKRAVVFARLIRELSAEETEFKVFKELGDGLLISALEFRPALELIVLLDAVREYWNTEVLRDISHPSLDSRAAVTYGDAHVLGEDYLGSPIDNVTRLSAYRSDDDTSIAVVSADVRERVETDCERDYPFLRFGENRSGKALFKEGEQTVWVSEVRVDRIARRGFSEFFDGARRVIAAARATDSMH